MQATPPHALRQLRRSASMPALLVLQRGPTALERGAFDLDTALLKSSSGGRIRCPHCRWQPERRSRWMCQPAGLPEMFAGGCGMTWNTFDTRGLCPGCRHQWRHTSCLSCAKWAPHEAWYQHDAGSTPSTD